MVDRELGEVRIQNIEADGVLRAVRRRTLTDRIHLSGNDYIYPESFQPNIHSHWGILRRENGETFLLTERTFSQTVDTFFWLLPSRLIEYYLRRAQSDQVRVLDAGGGRDATTARAVVSRFPSVQMINIDLVAINEENGNFISQRGDLCDLNLPNGSIDFAYSHQVLPYMDGSGNFARPIKVIEGISRALKPGGTALIDYSNDYSTELLDVVRDRGSIKGSVFSKRKSYRGNFLLLSKDPVEPDVIRLVSGIPDSKQLN